MSEFNYVARDREGNLVRASIQAKSRHEALHSLKSKKLTVVDLFMTGEEASKPKKTKARSSSTAAPQGLGMLAASRTELAVFCRQLAISVNSGVPIRDALESIAEDVENPRFQRVLKNIINRLHEGNPLSAAMRPHEKQFGALFISLIRAAEEAGSMPQTLDQLATYLEKSERLARKIRSITAYPMFVMFFFTIVCLIMTVFILPQFQDIFSDFDAELPKLTTVLFGINQFLLDNATLILLGAAGLIAILIVYSRTSLGRYHFDRVKLALPFFGPCMRKFAVARFCRNLGIMLKGGVPVTTALDITASVSGNKVLEESIKQTKERILTGMDISSSMALDPQFPRVVIRMVNVGETSGNLPDVMEKVADNYEDQVEGSIMVATSLFEPLIICFFGALVLVLVLAIYMPVFTVASGVR